MIGCKVGFIGDFKYFLVMVLVGFIWIEDKLCVFFKVFSDVVFGNKMCFWGIGSDK